MAKAAKKSVSSDAAPAAKSAKPVVPNLFAKAQSTGANSKKAAKGTIFELPKVLNDAGELKDDCARLHNAVSEIIQADEDCDKAKNRGNLARGTMNSYAFDAYVSKLAQQGVIPEGPVQFVNYRGEKVTYVVSNKTCSQGLSEEQIEEIRNVLGETADSVLVTRTSYSFNGSVMEEIAGEFPKGDLATLANLPRVADIIREIVSEAIVNETRLTDEQKAGLICATTKTTLQPGVYDSMVAYVGPDVSRLKDFFVALGSSVPRYFKS